MKDKKTQSYIQLIMLIGVLLFVNIISNYFNYHIDLTEEKRFTLSPSTVKMIQGIKEPITVQLLLDGQFPAGFKRLQSAAIDVLERFHSINPKLEYKLEDPNVGAVEQISNRRKKLSEQGIMPVNLRVIENGQTSEKLIYPVALFNFATNTSTINLLENESPGMPKELVLNNSVSLLEYKFANAIQKLTADHKPNIVFLTGHGELPKEATADLEKTLRQYFDTGRFNLDSNYVVPKEVDVLVIAKPQTEISERHKFMIDQYIMNGGKVIWLIDKLTADMSLMANTGTMVPTEVALNLDDMFFKYGFRVQPDMVLDIECSKIPLKIGQQGDQPQMDLFPWFYFPSVTPKSQNPIVKSLDRIFFQYPSSIDTIKTKSNILKTPILSSSQYSRIQKIPTNVSFDILRYPTQPEKFNKPNQTLGLLLEGKFGSLYENRITEEMKVGLDKLKIQFKSESVENRMLVFSDGDLIRNDFNMKSKSVLPLGYNRFENFKYANKDLMVNAIEYMLDKNGVIESRSKEVKLRLLDSVTANNQKLYWQLFNILLPLVFLGIFAFWFQKRRKKLYSV
jgi:ABC-2 type transport system permease protein